MAGMAGSGGYDNKDNSDEGLTFLFFGFIAIIAFTIFIGIFDRNETLNNKEPKIVCKVLTDEPPTMFGVVCQPLINDMWHIETPAGQMFKVHKSRVKLLNVNPLEEELEKPYKGEK